jgi:hypothetical protein
MYVIIAQRLMTSCTMGNHSYHCPEGYDGTCVKPVELDSLRLMHRMSFGHRNWRTNVVVVYSPDRPECQAIEFEV